MNTNTRPRSTLWGIIGVIITAIGTAFAMYSWYIDNQQQNIVTLQGLLVDKSDKPVSVIKIWLEENFTKSFDGSDKKGLFEIQNIELPDNNKLNLVFQLKDSTIEQKSVDIPNPRNVQDGILSIGVLKIESEVPLSAVPVVATPEITVETPIIQETYRAYVNTLEDPLRLRDSPNGIKIGSVPKGKPVLVIYPEGEVSEINGRIGKWCKVRYKEQEGYVFSGYLDPNKHME